jgi:hypothetical protein
MKIEKLTNEQKSKIKEYRDRYFANATKCDPANRERAEKAAIRMSEIAEIKINTIHWVNNPTDARSFSDSISDSLSDSLWDSLWASMFYSLLDSLSDLLWDSLSNLLRDSLRDSLWVSLWASLRDSLRASLSDSLRASLRDSLRASLLDSLLDAGWLALFSFCIEELKIKIDDSTREKLLLHDEIAASCFALWIVPGKIIICERPKSVEIIDGKLVGIEWR